MRVLAVGDIHTKLWILNEVAEIAHNYDAVIFVGDYADDWHSSPAHTITTWTSLMTLQKMMPTKIFATIGNHDYIYVNRTSTISGGYNQTTQFMLDTPENYEIRGWLKRLPITFKFDGVTYSHAGVLEDWNPKSNPWDDISPLWARPGDGIYKNMPQVFGHTPQKTCTELQPDVWCIDTFSTYQDDTPIGDGTVLEVMHGKKFRTIKLKAE